VVASELRESVSLERWPEQVLRWCHHHSRRKVTEHRSDSARTTGNIGRGLIVEPDHYPRRSSLCRVGRATHCLSCPSPRHSGHTRRTEESGTDDEPNA
jgi:hypothetical protein